jgi:hypothetical protein
MQKKQASELCFIYDMNQAQYMIEQLRGEFIYKIGVGYYGDPCISFIKNDLVLRIMYSWEGYPTKQKQKERL